MILRFRPLLLAAVLVAAAGCSRGGEDEAARRQIFTPGEPVAPAPPFDPARPLDALRLDAGTAAMRAGAFAWEARITWSAVAAGAAPLRTVESHRLVQLASGDFEVLSEIDPGGGPGSVEGRQVTFVGGRTWARGRWAPARARDSDRGEEARRHREQSYGAAADLLLLFQPALRLDAAGTGEAAGRRALRYRVGLSQAGAAAPAPSAPPAVTAAAEGKAPPAPDGDTLRRLGFLAGRAPLALEGEVLLDAASGLPLSVNVRGALGGPGDPAVRVDVELSARVTATGSAVRAVQPPAGALPDERRPRGVARALEAAGLRKSERPPVQQEEDDAEP